MILRMSRLLWLLRAYCRPWNPRYRTSSVRPKRELPTNRTRVEVFWPTLPLCPPAARRPQHPIARTRERLVREATRSGRLGADSSVWSGRGEQSPCLTSGAARLRAVGRLDGTRRSKRLEHTLPLPGSSAAFAGSGRSSSALRRNALRRLYLPAGSTVARDSRDYLLGLASLPCRHPSSVPLAFRRARGGCTLAAADMSDEHEELIPYLSRHSGHGI